MRWETVTLADVIDVRDGTHDSPKYVMNGYPLITSKNIIEGRLDFTEVNLISKEDYDKINKRSKVDVDDIIMPMIGTIGNPHLVISQPEYAIKNVALFKLASGNIGSKYLYYLLISPIVIQQLDNSSRGGTQKFVSLKNLRDLKIPLPPLETQKRIVSLLDQAQGLIDKRKEQIALMDQLIQSLFYDMFGDPVTNPKGYKIKNLEDLVENSKISYGIVQPGDDVKEGIPIVRPVDLQNNPISIEQLKKTTAEIEQKHKKTRLIGNELLISVRGTTGDTLITNELFKGFNVTRGLAVLRVINTNLVYLNNFLQTDHAQRYISVKTKGATLRQINLSDLKVMPIIVPSYELQEDFAKREQKIHKQKEAMTFSLSELEGNFNSIMQRAFKGELT